MTLAELRNLLGTLLPADDKPIVVYSGLWAIGRSFDEPFAKLPALLTELLLEVAGPHRTLAMPSYTNGFKSGFLDLDREPSQTGVLTEHFRKRAGTRRGASAFFSFSLNGPEAERVTALRPRHAWGEGSVFSWMEERDAHLLMLGESWDVCSLKHRCEFLERVPYRSEKEFRGEILLNGARESLVETLFVRSLNPNVENRWHNLDALLAAEGMRTFPLGGSQLSAMSARKLMKAVLARLREDPFAFTHDPALVRSQFPPK